MKFSVPVTYTTTGWILITADNLDAAKAEVARLNDVGIAPDAINDPDDASEVHADEILALDEVEAAS